MLKLRKNVAMNRKRQPTVASREEEKEANAVIRILQSSTCRKLFSWGGSNCKGAMPCELTDEAKEEQRMRWNFDFQTETPLPGRYQWIRTDDQESDVTNTNNNNSDEAAKKRPATEIGRTKKRRSNQNIQCVVTRRALKEATCDKTFLRKTTHIHLKKLDLT